MISIFVRSYGAYAWTGGPFGPLMGPLQARGAVAARHRDGFHPTESDVGAKFVALRVGVEACKINGK